MPATPNNFKSYQGLNAWGQVFTTAANTNYSVRVHARNPVIYFLRPSGWVKARVNSGPMGGAYWRGDFQPSANSSATSRAESGGGYSTSLSALKAGGPDVYHFWWDGMFPHIQIPSDAKGIVISTQMRLIPDGSGSVANSKLIASISGDLYKTVTTQIAPGGINPGIAQSRMKYVTPQWQTFYAATLTPQQLRSNPPPLTS